MSDRRSLDLFEPATDWTNQANYERLTSAAQVLYVNGYLSRATLNIVSRKLARDLDRAGELRAKGFRK